MSQSWTINPNINDYVLQNGQPVQTDSLTIPAYFRLIIPRTQWMYAPDTNYGADFYLIKKLSSTQNVGTVEATAAAALQPIVDDGRSSGINVTTQVLTRGGVGMEVDITDARGQIQETIIVPIT